MKKYLLLVALLTITCVKAVNKPWTFLVYMAAANDLNPFALYDLQEMMKVGSSPYVNILVYLTIQEDGKEKQTKKLYIEKNNMRQIGPDMVRDSGNVNTLVEALQWACGDYPSDHLAVVLWDHGSGPLNRTAVRSKGVCYDYDTGNYLTDSDCFNAFSLAKNSMRAGKKIDIIACDACLLASLELAYTFAECADYYVASEENIPGDGFQYTYVLNTLANQTLDAASFAKLMVNAYNQEYAGTQNYTLSATDLNALAPLVSNVNAVASVLTTQLKSSYATTVKNTLKKCVDPLACPFFDGTYLDLLQFYKNLLKNVNNFRLSSSAAGQFKQLLTNGIALFSKVIIANVTSTNYMQKPGGLTMYFGKRGVDQSYYDLYWTKNNPQWLKFLEAYNTPTSFWQWLW